MVVKTRCIYLNSNLLQKNHQSAEWKYKIAALVGSKREGRSCVDKVAFTFLSEYLLKQKHNFSVKDKIIPFWWRAKLRQQVLGVLLSEHKNYPCELQLVQFFIKYLATFPSLPFPWNRIQAPASISENKLFYSPYSGNTFYFCDGRKHFYIACFSDR